MSIWDKYPDLNDDELRTVVGISAQALAESLKRPADIPGDLLEYSPRAIARMLAPLLQERDASINAQQIQELLEDETLGREVCLKFLDEARQYPAIAEHIAAAYAARMNKMAVPESLLLTGALVVLAIRVREINWSKDKKVIKFNKASEVVRDFLIGLLKSQG